MSSTTKLLPCPFCSNADISIKNENPMDNSGGYFIECPGCGASTSLRFACGDDPTHLLAEQWNRRTASHCLHQIQEPAAAEQAAWHAGLDEGWAQAAPAAVAVPDERAAFEAWASTQYAEINLARDGNEYRYALAKDWWPVWKASRAALAATPAASPVVMPEPDGFLESHPLGPIYHRGKPSQMQTFCGACPPMYEAGTVRALLATTTGLPAQAVAAPTAQDSCCAWSVWWTHDKAKHTTTRQASIAAWDAGIAYALERTTPQAQADARDAGRSDAEIVSQTEALARYLLSWKWGQAPESDDAQMRNSTNHKAQACWQAACEIQELITDTDVENAVSEVDDAAIAAAKGE